MTPAERNAVLEEAAQMAERRIAAIDEAFELRDYDAAMMLSFTFASAIRALKEQEPTT